MCVSHYLVSAMILYLNSISGNVYLFQIGNIQSFTSQIFGVIGPLRVKLDFDSPFGFDVQRNSDLLLQKSSSTQSKLKLKLIPNKENLIHGRETAPI